MVKNTYNSEGKAYHAHSLYNSEEVTSFQIAIIHYAF